MRKPFLRWMQRMKERKTNMGISKAQKELCAQIDKTEAYLRHGEICLTEAAEYLMKTIREAQGKYYIGECGRIDSLSAYHRAFAMLARVTK